VAADVLVEHDDDLRHSDSFASTLEITRATYTETEASFHDGFADTFGLDTEQAAERIEANGVSREEFAALKALQHHLDGVDPDDLLQMAGMVTAAGAYSPVPESMTELQAPLEATLDGTDAIVFVFKRDCAPCERLRAELDAVLEAAPKGLAVFGVDGPERPEFLDQYEVTVAPSALLFRDGNLVGRLEGYQPTSAFHNAFAEQY
jgi:thiol-disulfide isomerase/thioredoxin